jgi:hypothetical protein
VSEGRTPFAQASPPSDVQLPPYARRLDVRATRAAFAAGTLSTVGDDVAGENVKGDVEVRHADGYDANVVHELLTEPAGETCEARAGQGSTRNKTGSVSSYSDHEPREWYDEAEQLRQSRLRRWQTIR